VKNWREEVFAFFDFPATNGYTEALNGVIKVVNRAGRGYSLDAIKAKLLFGGMHRLRIPRFGEANDEGQKTWENFIKRFAEGMRRTHDALDRVELLAQIGWTLPTEMSVPQANSMLMQDKLTPQSIDDYFVRYYRDNGGAAFRSLKDRLVLSDHLAPWRPLIQQAISAFERGEYAICVPTLLLVLEGSIAVPWGVKFQNERERQRFFNRRIEAVKPTSIMGYVWKSVAAFIDIVFESAVSPKTHHAVPKRNLILHGKSDPTKWDEADCLRLFQALSTVVFVSKELEMSLERQGVESSK
jgi:hypothetical protein